MRGGAGQSAGRLGGVADDHAAGGGGVLWSRPGPFDATVVNLTSSPAASALAVAADQQLVLLLPLVLVRRLGVSRWE